MLKRLWPLMLLLSLLLVQSQATVTRSLAPQDEDVPENGVIIENPSKNTFQLRLRNTANAASWDDATLNPGHGTYLLKDRVQVLYQGRLTADRPLQYQVRYQLVPTSWGWDVQPKR